MTSAPTCQATVDGLVETIRRLTKERDVARAQRATVSHRSLPHSASRLIAHGDGDILANVAKLAILTEMNNRLGTGLYCEEAEAAFLERYPKIVTALYEGLKVKVEIGWAIRSFRGRMVNGVGLHEWYLPEEKVWGTLRTPARLFPTREAARLELSGARTRFPNAALVRVTRWQRPPGWKPQKKGKAA